MLYLLACFTGLIIGVASKGSIANFVSFKFEKGYLIAAAFIIQLAARLLSVKGVGAVKDASLIVYGASFVLFAVVIWFNRNYFGVILIGTGYLMNTFVMMLNGGKMPVSMEVLNKYGMTDMAELVANEIDGKHTLLTESTKLPWLADIIRLPSFLGKFMEVVSPGDLVIVLGFAILMFEIVKGKKNKSEVIEC